MPERPTITSPYAPDLAEVRAWIEKMIASMKFVELVVAMMALFTRMRDVNTELTKQVAHFRRRRPRSETLNRIERQLVLAFAGAVIATSHPAASEPRTPRSRQGRHPGRAALPAHLERVIVENPVPAELRICPKCGS